MEKLFDELNDYSTYFPLVFSSVVETTKAAREEPYALQ
jgi:hypothetical protein